MEIVNYEIPIGSIVAWAKSLAGVPQVLEKTWVECNGQALVDVESPLNGSTIPDLNASSGTNRFLRGATTSGGTGGTETHAHEVTVACIALTNTASQFLAPCGVHASSAGSTLPAYYQVVWIMKVK